MLDKCIRDHETISTYKKKRPYDIAFERYLLKFSQFQPALPSFSQSVRRDQACDVLIGGGIVPSMSPLAGFVQTEKLMAELPPRTLPLIHDGKR